MKALLILNRENAAGLRIIVHVRSKLLREQIGDLLKQDRGREAFDLLFKRAEFEAYLAPGQKPPDRPTVTLIEELL